MWLMEMIAYQKCQHSSESWHVNVYALCKIVKTWLAVLSHISSNTRNCSADKKKLKSFT